jgi:hypothetical protein
MVGTPTSEEPVWRRERIPEPTVHFVGFSVVICAMIASKGLVKSRRT